ncbi:glycosyltransferase family 4 protein [Patescibacteria group bacterium]|nr:glycosyltransferase family 4 protein [Patescibacteria group bacterium]
MRIGIDARFFGPVGKGLGRYVERLVENLEKLDKENEYRIFLRKENWDYYTPKVSNFKKVLADYPWYSLKEQIMMPLLIRREKLDLVHFPHFNIPIFCPTKFVATIHDLILLQFPTPRATTLGPLLYKIKYFGYRIVIGLGLRRAKRVITVSECTKKELGKFFKVNPEKIEVTYEACDGVEYGQLKIPERKNLAKFGITKPYLLYVGNAYPHKNLEGLLKIFPKLNLDCQLVLVGKEDYFYKRMKGEIWETEISKNIVFTEFVSEATLADLYRNARVYVFPSFVEGFGLPGLEAMSYGLPVVASNSSCLPEIYGEAAVYFDPKDEKDMIEKIRFVWADGATREKLINLGLEQVKKYSWESLAEKTLRIYQNVGKN